MNTIFIPVLTLPAKVATDNPRLALLWRLQIIAQPIFQALIVESSIKFQALRYSDDKNGQVLPYVPPYLMADALKAEMKKTEKAVPRKGGVDIESLDSDGLKLRLLSAWVAVNTLFRDLPGETDIAWLLKNGYIHQKTESGWARSAGFLVVDESKYRDLAKSLGIQTI